MGTVRLSVFGPEVEVQLSQVDHQPLAEQYGARGRPPRERSRAGLPTPLPAGWLHENQR